MTYRLWQYDIKAPMPESIRYALEHHEKKYGKVPNLIEHSNKLQDLPKIDGIRYAPVNIPANLLLLAVE